LQQRGPESTTKYGGNSSCADSFADGCGTVFAFNPKTGKEAALYKFSGNRDGRYPVDALIDALIKDNAGGLVGTARSGASTAPYSGSFPSVVALMLEFRSSPE
jgi:hypothetical protein